MKIEVTSRLKEHSGCIQQIIIQSSSFRKDLVKNLSFFKFFDLFFLILLT